MHKQEQMFARAPSFLANTGFKVSQYDFGGIIWNVLKENLIFHLDIPERINV